MAKYDFGGDFDGDDNEAIKLEPPCMIRVKLDNIFESSSRYGQSLGINMKDGQLVDGILGRGEKEDDFEAGEHNTGSLKVLSWDSEMSVPTITEDTTPDDLPAIVQRNYVGNTYKYEVQAARLEEDQEVGNPNVPEDEIEIGNLVFFTGATDNGPKSASKTLAKILSAQGRDAVLDEDSQDNWLDSDVALREDLVGREVILAMTKRTSDETGRTFHHPFILDGKTRAPIFTNNEDDSGQDDSDEEEQEEEEEEEAGYPEGLESFYETCHDLSIYGEDAVEGLLDDMLNDGEIDQEAVDNHGRDQIIEDLTN